MVLPKPFEFPILPFDDAISPIDVRSSEICIISMDARKRYNHISVRHVDS